MKFCPHCRRWNQGHPFYCNYCGRTWSHRLCPRGHENRADSQFCSVCGRPVLSETAGHEPLVAKVVSLLPKFLKYGLISLAVLLFVRLLFSVNWSSHAGFFIVLVLLLLLLRYSLSVIRDTLSFLSIGFLLKLFRRGTKQRRRSDRR